MTVAAGTRTRRLGPDDAGALAELSQRLGGAETPEQWASYLARPSTVAIGALAGSVIVGYAAGDVRTGFGMPAPTAWVEQFGVDLAWRARGVGWTLAQELLRCFREKGAAHAYTVVPLHDRVLGPFFRQLGFRDELLACLGCRL